MEKPKANIMLLNYNSMRFRDIMIKSLEPFLSLNYPSYEVIIVDNASNDGSLQLIRQVVEGKKCPGDVEIKFVLNEANPGYASNTNCTRG